MSATLEILDPGYFVSIQDRGRFGRRALGVPTSGALDPLWLEAANALAGAPAGSAAFESRYGGLALRAADAPVRVALVGGAPAEIEDADGRRRKLAPQSSARLAPGEVLRLARAPGLAYLAVSGGLTVRPMLGSRSFYGRARIGGFEGAPLAKGQILPCAAATGDEERRRNSPPAYEDGPIRVIAGPQADHFPAPSLDAFYSNEFKISPASDRMGLRLIGPQIAHNERGAEILSDGASPGAIQIPADGQPILLLADAQTSGGYAKIACAISADLPRLAHLAPGAALSFRPVALEEARAAGLARRAQLAAWIAGVERFSPPGRLNEARLYDSNLIGGVVCGDEPPG